MLRRVHECTLRAAAGATWTCMQSRTRTYAQGIEREVSAFTIWARGSAHFRNVCFWCAARTKDKHSECQLTCVDSDKHPRLAGDGGKGPKGHGRSMCSVPYLPQAFKRGKLGNGYRSAAAAKTRAGPVAVWGRAKL